MSSAFVIKSARIETLSILLKDGNTDTLTAELAASSAQLAQFKGMPFLLDVHLLSDPWGLDIKAVWKCFAAHQVRIIGIRHIEADYEAKVAQYGLPFILISNKEKDAPTPQAKAEPQAVSPVPPQSNVQQEQIQRLKDQVLQLKQQLQQAQVQPQAIMQQEQVQRLKEQVLQLKQQLQQTQQPQVQPEQVERLKTQVLQLKQQLAQAQQGQSNEQQLLALQQELQQAKQSYEKQVQDLQQQLQQAQQTIQEQTQRQPEPQVQQPVQRNLPTSSPTIIVDKPVRSGQQIYAEGGDVICTALVSQGSEIIADGNIHIYAPFRGRALAGASGDKNARIFIHSMQGQLISIAGVYRIFDKDLPASLYGKSVVVSLDGGKLNITALSGIS